MKRQAQDLPEDLNLFPLRTKRSKAFLELSEKLRCPCCTNTIRPDTALACRECSAVVCFPCLKTMNKNEDENCLLAEKNLLDGKIPLSTSFWINIMK